MKYKLNVIKIEDDKSGVLLGKNEEYICMESYRYIKKKGDLQKAYDECDNPRWISALTNILDLTNKTIYAFIMNKGNTSISRSLIAKYRSSYINFIKKEYPWERLKNILIEKEIIIPKEFRLNVHIINDDIHIGYDKNIICKESFDYINKFPTLKEAYENCKEADYFDTMLDIIDDKEFEYLSIFISKKCCNYNRSIHKKDYRKDYFEDLDHEDQSKLIRKWNLEFVRKVKKAYSWEKLKPILIDKGILIEED